jgi:hypothetical protein
MLLCGQGDLQGHQRGLYYRQPSYYVLPIVIDYFTFLLLLPGRFGVNTFRRRTRHCRFPSSAYRTINQTVYCLRCVALRCGTLLSDPVQTCRRLQPKPVFCRESSYVFIASTFLLTNSTATQPIPIATWNLNYPRDWI